MSVFCLVFLNPSCMQTHNLICFNRSFQQMSYCWSKLQKSCLIFHNFLSPTRGCHNCHSDYVMAVVTIRQNWTMLSECNTSTTSYCFGRNAHMGTPHCVESLGRNGAGGGGPNSSPMTPHNDPMFSGTTKFVSTEKPVFYFCGKKLTDENNAWTPLFYTMCPATSHVMLSQTTSKISNTSERLARNSSQVVNWILTSYQQQIPEQQKTELRRIIVVIVA